MTEQQRKYSEREWYSHGLTAEGAENLERFYALISEARFEIGDFGPQVTLHLRYLCDEGRGCQHIFQDMKVVEKLMRSLNTGELPYLEGKVVETYNEGRLCRGISVNPNFYK